MGVATARRIGPSRGVDGGCRVKTHTFNATTSLFSACSIDEASLSINGVTYEPDATKGYMECAFSHSWPVVTYYGECLSPETVARSSNSVMHQPVNREHRMRIHDPEHRIPDEVIGCVVGSETTHDRMRNGLVPTSIDDAPGIRAVAAIFKQAHGVDKLLGQHQSGRSTFVVSMEVMYDREQSGFVMLSEDAGDEELKWTPASWRKAGLVYIPVHEAGEEFLSARDWKLNRMKGKRPNGKGYCGIVKTNGRERECYWMMGGLSGQVHYSGLAIVKYGAEPSARIVQMLAHVPEEEGGEDPASGLVRAMNEALDQYLKNS